MAYGPRYPRIPSVRLLLARPRRSALGREAWNLLGRSAWVRRLVTPFRPAPDVYDFDPDYYLAENPAVAASGIDPFYHYLQYGREEGRWPNATARARATLRLNELCNPYAAESGLSIADPRF